MKVLHLLIPFILFLSCSRKNTGSTNIQAFTIKDTIAIFEEEPLQEQDKPYTVVEQMPSFPGGEAEMQKFIRDNLKYPVVDEESGIHGRITVRFVVSKTGDIKDIQAIRGGILCDSLVSVVKRMPRWIPGRQNGEAVDVYFTLPMYINFKR
ncbi:MAG: energy transducer TonB [Prevotella sp.]|jgi:protein TonB|nr:energy transducer TonB [Prevotella sp.]